MSFCIIAKARIINKRKQLANEGMMMYNQAAGFRYGLYGNIKKAVRDMDAQYGSAIRKQVTVMFEPRAKKEARPKKKKSATFVMKPPKKISKLWLLLPVAIFIVVFAFVWVIRDNNVVSVSKHTVSHAHVPIDFNGYRIMVISDFYGKRFGVDNKNLIAAVNSQQYDMLILLGDYTSADGSSSEKERELEQVRQFLLAVHKDDVPVYYILGENDWMPQLEEGETLRNGWNRCIIPDDKTHIMQVLEECGAQFLYPIQEITRGNSRIFLTGIAYNEKLFDTYGFDTDKDFTITVTHKPIDYNVDTRLEQINKTGFREVDFDLTLSGHTLGGQYRLPFLGAVYNEEYGLFPQETYIYGFHKSQGRYSYITSGLGVPSGFRLFNQPEIAIIELMNTAQ